MKFLIKTAVDIKHTKEVAKKVTKLYKELNLDIDFVVEDIVLDIKQEELYETTSSWSFLKLKKQKSIRTSSIYMFHKPSYDGTCLFINKEQGLQDKDLRGQYTYFANVGIIEVYSCNRYIKKNKRNGITYYDDQKRKTNLEHDVFVLFHEVAHHLEKIVGLDGLHKAEEKDLQQIYIETLSVLLQKKTIKPLAKWETAISQKYGNIDWELYPKTGRHWGVDHAVPIGTPIRAITDGYVHSVDNTPELGLHCLFSFQLGDKYFTLLFAHLSKVWEVGEVKAGVKIAETGNTGKTTAPHLHTELWKGLVVDRKQITTMTLDPMGVI